MNRSEGSLGGLPIMKFVLTYDGELPSNGSPIQKANIRGALHPQLAELWQSDTTLKGVLANRHLPATGGYTWIEQHHSEGVTATAKTTLATYTQPKTMDLCAPITVEKREFIPLIRDSLALRCGLKILFLRKQEPGRIYQGGDLDNRLKTLLDALAVPNLDQVRAAPAAETTPMYTLLEDDRLVASLDVDTKQLLSRPGSSRHEVRLVIEVDVRVAQARAYNHPFLGN